MDTFKSFTSVVLVAVLFIVFSSAVWADSGYYGDTRMNFYRKDTLNLRYLGFSDGLNGNFALEQNYRRQTGTPVMPAAGFTGSSTTGHRWYSYQGYSCLVIDGRDLDGLVRDRNPMLYSRSGSAIFKGWELRYYSSIDAAEADGCIGWNPLIVKAIAVNHSAGSLKSPHLVISDEAAGLLLEANRTSRFLENGWVVILKQNPK